MLWDLARAEGPEAAARAALARIEAWADPALFIHRVPAEAVMAEARRLAGEGPMGRPLWGIPYVVKDNIDVAGMPTTAACPDYAFTPGEDAPCVARLRAAGAVLLGKVNLDQFATGLVGVRSPHGTPRNAVAPDCVPGGSSSGSASAVAAGIAGFSLGTDTAGSGRVPAGFQNIVGLKPSLGLVPTRGVVPACRSIDTVSVFAMTAAQAAEVLDAMAGADAADPYSRAAPASWRATGGAVPPALRVAVPEEAELLLDTPDDAALFRAALVRLEAMGATLERASIAPFLALARRLYDGAWVAERTAALRDMVENHADALHPTTRIILEGGLARRTVDAFDDFHAQAGARLLSRALFARFDLLAVPTAPGLPTLEAVAAEPIAVNSRNGTYTNFVNLLDLSAIAVPAGFRGDGRPAGITLVAPAFAEALLCAAGGALHHAAGLRLGASDETTPPPPPGAQPAAGEIALFCIGAHMAGLPLNGQVTSLGGRFLRRDRTRPEYRLHALGNRPGMVRAADGAAIEGEVWALPAAGIGPLLAQVPAPLGFGTVALESGPCLGFLAEASGVEGAPDITVHGGWRAWLAAQR
ncbi:allophanate hydrolase [Roseomonas populi]|uniref:Allophanate hydrolase n=1 Tax=Roseomonas populi TaxID=3121582 RepID=A0ABT1X1G5_9PROT|nr:allophanate hydrolase [Roseomonas pecuniae]MCR0981945.1 allophanate hydrolase [Roseomonas pecuniae]